METIRIGVVGVGFGAQVHIPAFQSEGMEVVAVCARHQDRADEAARRFGIAAAYTDYQALIEHPGLDAVSVVTPAGQHYEISKAALEAGKHVICEKPFTVDTWQARELWDLAQSSGLTAMMAHEFRFAPGRAYVKELVEQGYIGKPSHLSFTLLMGRPRRPGGTPARTPSAGSGGMLGALGSHYIDCMRDWFGEIVSAEGSVFGRYGEEGSPADANFGFSFLLRFANGGWGTMVSSFESPFGQGAKMEVYGSEGSLHTPQQGPNPAQDGIVLGAQDGKSESLEELRVPERMRPLEDDRDPRLAAFRLLVRQFQTGISEGTSPGPNFYDGLRCQRVLDAIQSCTVTGARVVIPAD
jgi:predicted dehydrogenase